MKVSYNWLQTYFDTPLPTPAELEDLLTFHSSEIDEVIKVGGDTVFDVKVLPDKSSWLSSHRGIAKEIATITGVVLKDDPLANVADIIPVTEKISISLDTPTCDYYAAALVVGIKVGPSPIWLQERLASLGQRSINNVVDATNYVMFNLGQPLHAFDANKLGKVSDIYQLGVRSATSGESITTLTGESYELNDSDTIIIDKTNDSPIGIAGVKGGMAAAVDESTTELIIEAAHFDRVAIRNTSKQLKLRTDASYRYENGISKALAPIGLSAVVKLIIDIAGGELVGYSSEGESSVSRDAVTCSLVKINSVLGLSLVVDDVSSVLSRFGYSFKNEGEVFIVVPPFERDDIVCAEDLIEEIGRMYGLQHVVAIPPTQQPLTAYNARHYYAEKIRAALVAEGFSEVFTSSFRNQDIVKIKNAFASDKGYLRSSLSNNLTEVCEKNIAYRDLLGLSAVKVFEIGTVFDIKSESFRVGLAVQTGTSYKAKVDDFLLDGALTAITSVLGREVDLISRVNGVIEFSLDDLLTKLPKPNGYDTVAKNEDILYKPFSIYPSVSRDIAMWVEAGVEVGTVEAALRAAGGSLLERLTHLDTFTKDGRTSMAFRLVFQSNEKTLAGSEVDMIMDQVYAATKERGWEAR